MTKTKRIILSIISLLSISMINMPIFKRLGTTAVSLFNQNSMAWFEAAMIIGVTGINILKISFSILVISQIIALISIFSNQGKHAKLWNFIAGAYELVIALGILFYCLQFYRELNSFLGIEVFEQKAGDGVYAMIFLGILQIVALFVGRQNQENDRDIFDILSGK